jgi:hypothetical protein
MTTRRTATATDEGPTTITVDPDGTVLDIDGPLDDEPRALIVSNAGIDATGVLAIADLTDAEFDRRLDALKKGAERIARIQRALMEKDVDYGVIPGTKKPTLLKPGAEKLCLAYSLAADFLPKRTIGNGQDAPPLSYLTRCDLHRGSIDGPIVAVGYGAANSWETRYRYRAAERTCPACGASGTILKSKHGKPEWFCWAKRGGCGATFALDEAAITEQVLGQIDNPDPFDLDVTLAKMAEKRAHVDATLRATGASSLFTQDVEDKPAAPPVEDDAPPAGEVEELLGVQTREGTVRVSPASSGAPTKLDVRQAPDGPWFGFALETAKGNLPQVFVDGDLAAAILIATPDPLALKGQWCRVGGKVYAVRQTGRATFHRMRVEHFETHDYKLPADPGQTGPGLFDAGVEAELDAALT